MTRSRGAVLFRSGRHDEAVQALQNTDDEVGLLFLTLAECARGKPAEAQQALDKVRRSLIRSSAADPWLPTAVWTGRSDWKLNC